MKRVIKASEDPVKFKIQPGMYWSVDWHEFTVTERTGDKCVIVETWIAEDSGKSCKSSEKYTIGVEGRSEYAAPVKYPNNRLFASTAFNLDEFYDEDDERTSDSVDDDDHDDYDDYDDYTPSSTCGDYSPSNPWDAPGMSISDFI